MIGRDAVEPPTVRLLARPVREPAEWPEYLPPFLAGAVSFAPDGLLWVQRITRAGRPPNLDLINEEGRVVGVVELPEARRLVGFGGRSVYLVRRDELDQEFLERYELSGREKPAPS